MGDIFWVANNFKYFWVLEIPNIFGGQTVDAGPEPTYGENIRVPPPTPRWGFKYPNGINYY